jgi:hypothetical protein
VSRPGIRRAPRRDGRRFGWHDHGTQLKHGPVLLLVSELQTFCIQHEYASAEGVPSPPQAAAAALPNMIPEDNLQKGFVYPPLDTIRCCCRDPDLLLRAALDIQ